MNRSRVNLFVACVVLLLSSLPLMGTPPTETRMPYIDPTTAPPGCSVPNGYSAACGYYASSANGECLCRQSIYDSTTLCMKSSAGSGCGLFESANDPCCQTSSGF